MVSCVPMASRHMPRTTRCACARVALSLAFAASAAACGDADAGKATGANAAESPADEALEADLPSDAPLDQLLTQKAKKYAAGLVADGEPLRGNLIEGARADHLVVLRGGHCYRVLGVAAPEVEDMDLFLFDPNGVQVQQDAAEDRFPALGLQAELCPGVSGAHRLQVHMYKGGGPYAARVYRTPP